MINDTVPFETASINDRWIKMKMGLVRRLRRLRDVTLMLSYVSYGFLWLPMASYGFLKA